MLTIEKQFESIINLQKKAVITDAVIDICKLHHVLTEETKDSLLQYIPAEYNITLPLKDEKEFLHQVEKLKGISAKCKDELLKEYQAFIPAYSTITDDPDERDELLKSLENLINSVQFN